jgi:hypothetical protein
MPKIQRVIVTAVTASVLLAGGTGIAAASPNGQHTDLLETDTYCGPGMRWEAGHCRSNRLADPPEADAGWLASALFGVVALAALAL